MAKQSRHLRLQGILYHLQVVPFHHSTPFAHFVLYRVFTELQLAQHCTIWRMRNVSNFLSLFVEHLIPFMLSRGKAAAAANIFTIQNITNTHTVT